MIINTLIIGFVPLADTVGEKPRHIKEDKYMKELFAEFDLGETHYSNYKDWREKIDEINPLFIILLGSDYYAKEVKERKGDAMLYVTHDAGQIFYRKAEMDEKIADQHKALAEVQKLVKQAREGTEEEIASMRKFAAMSYDDIYKMIKHAIISDNEKLRTQAWELLNDNNGHKNFIWMRAQLLAEVWDHCDGKGKEQFLCMAMNQHIDEGMARKLEDFTDLDDQKFHQYIFCDFFGYDLNYLRRIPFGVKGQDKWDYQGILDKYETPNGVQVMLEAGQMRSKKEENFKSESEKVHRVLKEWVADPSKSKKELHVVPWNREDSDENLLTEQELISMKNFLKKYDQSSFEVLFPEK